MSRLDRFLLSENLVLYWKVECQRVGKRELSNHCPMWLKSGGCDLGPKPFRFNNGLFKHEKFREFLENEWKLSKFEGRGTSGYMRKLKN